MNKRIMSIFSVVLLIFAVFSAGCSKDVSIRITDGDLTVESIAKVGSLIGDIISDAGMKLAEKDEVQPSPDTKLTENINIITVKRYAKVNVDFNGKKTEVELVGGKVSDALKKAGITLKDGMKVDPAEETFLKNGITIKVTIPEKEIKVKVTADGKTKEYSTTCKTVEDLLKKENITLDEDDELSVKNDAKLKDQMEIVIKRIEYKEEKKTEKVSYGTVEEYDSSMDAGNSKLTREGQTGEKEVTYKVKYADGKEVSREAVSEKVTKQPVDEIITYGTKEVAVEENEAPPAQDEVVEVGREYNLDCDGSGHGYWLIHYSNGATEVEEF